MALHILKAYQVSGTPNRMATTYLGAITDNMLSSIKKRHNSVIDCNNNYYNLKSSIIIVELVKLRRYLVHAVLQVNTFYSTLMFYCRHVC